MNALSSKPVQQIKEYNVSGSDIDLANVEVCAVARKCDSPTSGGILDEPGQHPDWKVENI